MTRPLIAVVADRKAQTSGAWLDVLTDGVPHSYVQAIENAGGDVVVFPVTSSYVDRPAHIIDLVDGVFLPGGRDVDATLYGEQPHPENDPPFTDRDRLELALVRAAVSREMPVFGACRGMQLINVALGGTLEQHLGDRLDQAPHRADVGTFTTHRVEVSENTRLSGLLPQRSLSIASHHHQAVGELGRGLITTAFADDGVPEALELPTGFCMGVQWHPEQQPGHEGLALTRAFIDASTRYRRERSTT